MHSSIKLQNIRDAFTTQDNTERIVLRNPEEITPGIHQYLLDVLRNLSDNVGGFDLPYDIVSRATNELPPTLEELNDLDPYNDTYSSVYTSDRLDYLTINNQYDITQVLKETDAEDIATACAIWYDRATAEVIQDLINFIQQ